MNKSSYIVDIKTVYQIKVSNKHYNIITWY